MKFLFLQKINLTKIINFIMIKKIPLYYLKREIFYHVNVFIVPLRLYKGRKKQE